MSESTTFKLCFDITVPDNRSNILTNGSSFSNKYQILSDLDFNNHCIYTSDGYKIFKVNNNISSNNI